VADGRRAADNGGLRIHGAGVSDVGRKRRANEDSYTTSDDLRLYVVADGMGGHAAGEVASRLAVESIERHIAAAQPDLPPTVPSETSTLSIEDPSLPVPARRVLNAIRLANQEIVRSVRRDQSMRGMGTTVVLAYIQGKRAYIGSVGDSRAYLVRDGAIRQLTDDHTFVNEQVRAGTLTAQEARRHPARNILTRAVGSQDDIEADVIQQDLKPGDQILLCSDGLTTMVEDEDILDMLRGAGDPEAGCKSLVDLANQRGGDDNITAVLIQAGRPQA
jgi:PPM family protein phosphatase